MSGCVDLAQFFQALFTLFLGQALNQGTVLAGFVLLQELFTAFVFGHRINGP